MKAPLCVCSGARCVCGNSFTHIDDVDPPAKFGALYWRSTACEETAPFTPEDAEGGYKIGDWEKCLCGDLKCRAIVEQGTPVLRVVGASPAGQRI